MLFHWFLKNLFQLIVFKIMKTIINIFGTGRSGTTMLDLMLGNDDMSFSLGEVHAWFRPYREHHFKIICSCGEDPCPYWTNIQHLDEKDFHKKSFDLLNVDYLIDSSKNLNWGIDNNFWAQNNDLKVFNILLYKTPVNYIYSIWKRGGNIDTAINRYTKYYKHFLQTNLPYVSLQFEHLTNDPEYILERICKITGQQYFSDKKKFWKKHHHHAFGSLGTRKQVDSKKSLIRTNEEFPKEYLKILPGIELKLYNNKEFNYISKKLHSNDIKYGYHLDNNTKIVIPYWYYLNKLKVIYFRRFPKKWNYIQ